MKFLHFYLLTIALTLGRTGVTAQQQPVPDDMNFDISNFTEFEYNNFDRKELYDKIIPMKEYLYFEVRTADGYDVNSYVTSIGDSSTYSERLKGVTAEYGFFNCPDHFCGSYIVALTEEDSVEVIDSDQELQSFIGDIDNIEEVLLFCRANELYHNSDTIITNSYFERERDYLLYMYDWVSCPDTDYSFKAQLTKDGKLTILDKTKIRETEDCFSH
ncbi:hypothetical protein [Ekhidna sp. To15]|uniref:hypothetical protein n=1 Tax=Ekhidna sp. To15 TaxID=3395267 RepID=UPI003F51F996